MRERIKLGGIMESDGRAIVKVVSVPNRPDAASVVLNALGKRNINIEFLVESSDINGNNNFTMCIDQKDLSHALAVLEGCKSIIHAKGISYRPNVSIISIFGPHFREKPRISGIMFSALASVGITSLAISTSISSVSCVVDGDQAELATKAITEAFDASYHVRKRPKDY